jgi:hypothetical protein
MPQQSHRFFVVISSLKYTLQNVVFLYTMKANLLFCEYIMALPTAKQNYHTGVYCPANIHITHISGENHGR